MTGLIQRLTSLKSNALLIEEMIKQKKIPVKKSLQALKKDLDKVFNEFIRLRDQKNGMFTCISCNTIKPISRMHAGHYHSAGHNASTRWNEFNVNGQCDFCNTFNHGNLVGYMKGLLKKYGQKVLDDLEIQRHNRSKMMSFEVSLLIQRYKEKVKQLKK